MLTSRRYLTLTFLAASCLALPLAGCSDKDHTEICVGPGCPGYDGAGGGSSGSGGSSGLGGSSGSGGSPESDAGVGGSSGSGELPDGGPDGGDPLAPCEVSFVSPIAPDGGDLTLVGADDEDGEQCGAEFTTRVTVASNGSSVNLFVNDSPVGARPVQQPTTDILAVLGNRGATPNTLRVEAAMGDGRTCSATFPSEIFVDCEGPSCVIQAPVANDDGFLNASADGDSNAAGLQTDVVVRSEGEHAGQIMKLQIDGTPVVPDATSVLDDPNAVGTFAAVSLNEGERLVQAECRDADGTITRSSETVWQVDVTPCSIDLESVAGGTDPITPAQDLDNLLPGIQVAITGTITGGDCRTLRVGLCGGSQTDIELTNLPEGGAFSEQVTVASSTGSFDVCGQVIDAAGNPSAPDQLNVNVRTNGPSVAIASPANDAALNSAVDANGATDTCETTIVVNCTEVGSPVTLVVDDTDQTTATCTAQTGLPEPFTGQATFAGFSLPSKNNGVATVLSARQSAAGLDDGTAPAISVRADCDAPACVIATPSTSADFLSSADDTGAAGGLQTSFVIQSEGDSIGQDVALTVDNVDAGTSPLVVQGGGSAASFTNVGLGEGARTIRATCTDPAGNTATAEDTWTVDTVACTSSLVIASGANPISPANDTDLGTAGLQVTATGTAGASDCVSSRVGLCSSTLPAFAPLVGGAFSDLVTLAATSGSQDVCLEIGDQAGNIGSVQSTVNVDVDAPGVAITAPLANAIFNVATTCNATIDVSCTDIGDPVTLLVDGVLAATANCGAGNTVSFDDIALPTKNDGAATVISATQTADGLTSEPATVSVLSDCEAPAEIAAPTYAVIDRFAGTGTLSWLSVLDGTVALTAYELRCALADIDDETAWTAATPVVVANVPPASAGVSENLAFTDFHRGMRRFCVVRGRDAIGNLGALDADTAGIAENPFLQQAYTVVDDPNAGAAIPRVAAEPLGDINGDGIADFAYGATQRRVQVFFGKDTIGTNPTESPDFEITFGGSLTNTQGFASEVAGLGDVNGDTIPDFAVGAPGANAVFVFFGRATDTWATLDVDAAGACEADLCILSANLGGTGGGQFGWDVHSANVDGTGANDLVVGARFANTVGQAFVLLAGAQFSTAGTTLTVDTTDLAGSATGFVLNPPADRTAFGFSVGSVGNNALVGAPGAGGGTGALYLLPQQPAPAGSGLTEITTPTLIELDTGVGANFGVSLRGIGDYDGNGFDDFAAGEGFSTDLGRGNVTVYLGSASGFSSASTLTFTNNLTPAVDDNYGNFIATGSRPSLGIPGDLDGDGFADLLIGASVPDSPAGSVGSAQLFYGAEGAGARTRSTADFTYTSTLASGQVVPNFVGDINDDTHNDLVILDSGAGANVLFLLY